MLPVRRVTVRRSADPWLWANLAVKAALVGLLLFAVVRDDLPRFQGKAMAGRALTYPIAALVVPMAWWIAARRRRAGRPHLEGYPHAADVLLVLPFLIDVGGNALDLYDSVGWWDDLNHLVNWAILSAAFGQLLVQRALAAWTVAGLVAGFGAITAILWEIAEYVTFIRDSPEIATAYTDTLGDLSLGLTGSVAAAALTAWLSRRARRGPGPVVRPIGGDASSGMPTGVMSTTSQETFP